MAKKSGRTGFVDTASVVIGITQWSLDYTADMLETTDFSASGIAAYIPGVSRWSGTFSGYKDGTPIALGVTNSVSIVLGESSVSTERWSGVAFISGIHPSTNFDGVVSYAYDFQGTAALTVPTA